MVGRRLGGGRGGVDVGGELALDLGVADEEGGPRVVGWLGEWEVWGEPGGWAEGGGFEPLGTESGRWGHGLC